MKRLFFAPLATSDIELDDVRLNRPTLRLSPRIYSWVHQSS